jgi:ABC-type transport system involved in multi-copper enzyme maturation permease subunit
LNDLISISIAGQGWSFFPVILKSLYYVLPNLEHFNVRNHVVYQSGLPAGYTGFVIAYGGLYVVLFLFLSCLIFRKKDL